MTREKTDDAAAEDEVAAALLHLAQVRTGHILAPGTIMLVQWVTTSPGPEITVHYDQFRREVHFTPGVHDHLE